MENEIKEMTIFLYDSWESYLKLIKEIEKKNLLPLNLDFLDEKIISNFKITKRILKKMEEKKIIIIGNLSYFNIEFISTYFFYLPFFIITKKDEK